MRRDCCGQYSGLATATLDSQSSKSRTSLAPVTWAFPSNLRAWLTASTVDTHVYVSPPPLASMLFFAASHRSRLGHACVPRARACVCMYVCLQYEPELFPGLIYRMQKPKVVLLVFVSGKVVLTGGKVRLGAAGLTRSILKPLSFVHL